jgi:hypothetical protein
MASYMADRELRDFFSVVSLSLDKAGNAYVSTMEGRKYPFTAIQWHPEKHSYEWTPTLHIPHSPEAVRELWFFCSCSLHGCFPFLEDGLLRIHSHSHRLQTYLPEEESAVCHVRMYLCCN